MPKETVDTEIFQPYLGAWVKKRRLGLGLTQRTLAGQVDGLSESVLSRIERGQREPATWVIWDRLSVALDAKFCDFFLELEEERVRRQ